MSSRLGRPLSSRSRLNELCALAHSGRRSPSQVEGERWDVSANITVGAGVSGGASVGYGETEGSSAWVNEQSSIVGSGSVNIRTEGHTQIDGAVIANIDENGNDAGNLTLDTGSLAYTDIADHDKEKSYYLNVGFTTGDDSSTNQTEGGTNYNASGNYSNHDKEQINRATVGEGSIVVRDNAEQDLSDLNRDTSLAQEVTKDDSKDMNLYASTTALDSLGNLVENPEQQLNKWKDNVASIGSPDAYMGLLNASLDALEQTPGAINDAIEAVEYFVDNIGKLSPEEAAALNDKLNETQAVAQALLNSDDITEQQLGEKLLADIAGLQDELLAQQGELPEDSYQIADAPPLPEKSFTELQNEFDALGGLLNDYYAEGQQIADQNLETGINKGEYAASKNETVPGFASDIDFDDAIAFLQNQRESAYSGLGLGAGASEGGLADFIGWTAASATNESWQAAQFLGKTGAFVLTLGSTSSPLDGSGYHSLIGDGTAFGSPQTFAGAVGVEQGVVTSYFAGVEGIAVFGLKIGAKSAGAVGKANDAGNIVHNSGGSSVAYHATNGSDVTQNILDGINPDFLNPESRFGKAFYVGDSASTVNAELAHHGSTSTHAIRYSIDSSAANVLDLTNPKIAEQLGYSGGSITDKTKDIGEWAQQNGFNVIKYNSERNAGGVNHAVLGDFDKILKPEIVLPTKE